MISYRFKVLIFFVLVLILFVFLRVLQKSKQSAQPNNEVKTVELGTKTTPILYPHQHLGGDSIYDPGHYSFEDSQVWKAPYDLWITSIKPEIKNAPINVLHHGTIIILNEKDQLCPNPQNIDLGHPFTSEFSKKIYSVSNETFIPWIFPKNYGIFIKKDSQIMLSVMLHNPLPPIGPGGIYKNVSMKVSLEIIHANKKLQFHNIEYYKLHLDDRPCSGVEEQEVFTVPPKTQSFVKTDTHKNSSSGNPGRLVFDRSGVLIGMGGHLHPWEGGKKVIAYINGKQITEFIPKHMNKDPWSWYTPFDIKLYPIKKGDEITISALYSNPNNYPVRGAMGMLGLLFVPN